MEFVFKSGEWTSTYCLVLGASLTLSGLAFGRLVGVLVVVSLVVAAVHLMATLLVGLWLMVVVAAAAASSMAALLVGLGLVVAADFAELPAALLVPRSVLPLDFA